MDEFSALRDNGAQASEPLAPKRRRRKNAITSCDLSIAPNVVAPPSSGWPPSSLGSQLDNHQAHQTTSSKDLDETEKTELVSRIVATIKEQTKILESGSSGVGNVQQMGPGGTVHHHQHLPHHHQEQSQQHYDAVLGGGYHQSTSQKQHNQMIPSASGVVATIDVPVNWHRQLVDNSVIVYISPTGQIITSLEQVREYLTKPNVCKCGLTCPFRVEDVFNFDADVATSTDCFLQQAWSMAKCHSVNPPTEQVSQQSNQSQVVKRARGRPRKRKNEPPISTTNQSILPQSLPQQQQAFNNQTTADKPGASTVCVNVNALDPNSFIRHPARQSAKQQQNAGEQQLQTLVIEVQQSDNRQSENTVAFVIDSTQIASPNTPSNLYVRVPPEFLAAFLSQPNPGIIGVNSTNQQDGAQQSCFLVPIQTLGATISTTATISAPQNNTSSPNAAAAPGTPQMSQLLVTQQHQPTSSSSNAPIQQVTQQQQCQPNPTQNLHWQNDEMIILNHHQQYTQQTSSSANGVSQQRTNDSARKMNTSNGSACSVQSAASSGYHSANHTPINDSATVLISPNKQHHHQMQQQPNGVDLNYDYYLNTHEQLQPPLSGDSQQRHFYFDTEFYQEDQPYGHLTVDQTSVSNINTTAQQSNNGDLFLNMELFSNPYVDHAHPPSETTGNNTDGGNGGGGTNFYQHQTNTDLYEGVCRGNVETSSGNTNDINALFGSDCDYNSVFSQFTHPARAQGNEDHGSGGNVGSAESNGAADSGVQSLHD
ncbi:hypothetical protein ACOME3_007703 [Neoechinorhynchus agilis]